MTIVIYSWMIPLAVTITAFAFLRVTDANDQFRIGAAINQVAALIVSLIAWLIWAVLT